MKTSPIGFAGLAGAAGGELRLELQVRAVGHLEGTGYRYLGTGGTDDRTRHAHRFTARRVECEPGTVDENIDLPDIQRNPVKDGRERVRDNRHR